MIILLLLLFSISIIAQENQTPQWHQLKSPIYSNLSNLFLFSDQSGVASGDQLIILEGNSWHKMKKQPPSNVDLLYAISQKSIYVSSDTEFQESEMFYWNGKSWDDFYHPLANMITGIYFKDRYNGVIVGLGEIAILTNNKWLFLPPPTNNNITGIKVDNNSTIWVLTFGDGIFKYDGKWKKIKNSEQVRTIELFNDTPYLIGSDFIGVIKSDSIEKLILNQELIFMHSLSVVTNNYLIAAGHGGRMVRYSNNKLEQIKTNVSANLFNIKMISETKGWVIGEDGCILQLSDNPTEEVEINKWKGFEKITFHFFSKVVDDGYGAVAADFNNDGRTDIFTCGLYEQNHLYMNMGNLRFLDESSERGVSDEKHLKMNRNELNLGACAADFDNDGKIDIYITSLTTQNRLYHNTGDGYFVDYSGVASGVGKINDRTNSVITGDVDNDGDLDLFIVNENTTNRFFENNGAGIFEERTEKTNLTSHFGGTGASFADIDSDGDIDLFVTNWSTTNKLYKNLIKETGKLGFVDFTDTANVSGDVFTKSNGIVFADIDNDADMDIYVSNRKTSNKFYLNNGKGIFTDETDNYFGTDSLKSYGVVITDFDNDGFKDLYLANVGNNSFYMNLNGNKFIDQTELFQANVKGYSTGLTAADFDNDRNIDLYVSNYIGSTSTILKNNSNLNNSITLKLTCYENNASAIGAKIYAYESGFLNESSHLLFFSEANGGSGYASMNDLKQIIPVLDNEQIDVKVVFPTGKVIIRDYVLPGSIITISDVDGYSKRFISFKKYLTRMFFDHHRLFELIKWLFIFILLGFSSFLGKTKYNWSIKIISVIIFIVLGIYYFQQLFFQYDNLLFSTILPMTSIFAFIGIIHLSYERKRLKQETEIEKQKLQEKISRDLHDDLASTLGSISIYIELLKQAIENKSDNIWQLFNKSNNLLNNAKQTITDLIWTIKPTPEPITNFAARIRENFTDIFRNRNISFTVSNERIESDILLTSIEKHNLYLIIKEALNNILKYSDAEKVIISITSCAGLVNFTIRDNGVGFNYNQNKSSGNGLTNMINRGKELNANVNISSEKGEGTLIEVSFKK